MLAEIYEHHILDHTYATLSILGFNLPVTRHLAMMWLACVLLLVLVPAIFHSTSKILAPARNLLEGLVVFVRDEIVLVNLGPGSEGYTPYFCTLFTFILICNGIGLVPFGATATGNISVTAGLAFTTFALILFSGIRKNGLVHYVATLVPHGVPKVLYPLLFPIEVLGLFTKTLALCIRLFANMIGGHFALLTIIGLIFIFGGMGHIVAGVTVLAAVPMALFITLLEVLVVFLQAYVFTVLTAIFTGMAMNPH
jgi:F-type H+-transporting ATPase subunit a